MQPVSFVFFVFSIKDLRESSPSRRPSAFAFILRLLPLPGEATRKDPAGPSALLHFLKNLPDQIRWDRSLFFQSAISDFA